MCIHSLGNATIFTPLDPNRRYLPFQIARENWDNASSFRSHHVLFCFTQMPFEVENAPALFQRGMEVHFRIVKWQLAPAFLNDIVIISEMPDNLMHHIWHVLTLLHNGNLTLNLWNASFSPTTLISSFMSSSLTTSKFRHPHLMSHAELSTKGPWLDSGLSQVCVNIFCPFLLIIASDAAQLNKNVCKGEHRTIEN